MSSTDLPRPQGHYLPARRHLDMVFVSGMTPRRDGVLLHTGPVPLDGDAAASIAAVELATENALRAAEGLLADGECLASVLSLTVYLNAPAGYTAHSRSADHASRRIAQWIGAADLPSRAAVGVASLPGNAMVEITLVALVGVRT